MRHRKEKEDKVFGGFIDEHLQWDDQLQHIQNKIAKNTGVINKLRHFVSIHMLKQLYYTLIYPYLNNGIMSWGTACPTRLDKIKTKQNKCLCAICFSRTNENVMAYFQLLEILKLENIFHLKISSLVYKIIIRKTDVPKALINLTMEASDVYSYNTRYAVLQNYRPKRN